MRNFPLHANEGNGKMRSGKCENAKQLTQRSSCKMNRLLFLLGAWQRTVAALDQRTLSTHTHTHWQTCRQLAKRGDPANRIAQVQMPLETSCSRCGSLINLDIETLLTSINSNCCLWWATSRPLGRRAIKRQPSHLQGGANRVGRRAQSESEEEQQHRQQHCQLPL